MARTRCYDRPIMATQTVSADQETRGWIHIKEGGVPVASIWFTDIQSVAVAPTDLGETQISLRNANGLWHKTTASVSDVNRAIAVAGTLFDSAGHRKSA